MPDGFFFAMEHLRTKVTPSLPNRKSHSYELYKPISVLRDVRWYISSLLKFNITLWKQTVVGGSVGGWVGRWVGKDLFNVGNKSELIFLEAFIGKQ